ncbi:MAG: beta-lactamase family protein [Actinobacteria bacterium]|nr:beta-lactamase family protein [Actinomycetota bacterium]
MNPVGRIPVIGAAVVLLAISACTGDSESDSDSVSATTTSSTETTMAATRAPTSSTSPESTTTSEPVPESTEAPVPEPVDYDFSAVSPIVQDFVDERWLNGAGLIIVHRDDGVIYEDHWGEFSKDRVSLIASSSKMITAGVLLRLQDEGLLDIDAPVADAVEWGVGNPEVTPAQLMSNSSGLVGLVPNPAYGPYICQYLPFGTIQDCAASIFNNLDDENDVVAPDTEFRYGGAQWQVAGAVAEAVSGKSWAELIDEIYVQPCALESLAYNNNLALIASEGFRYPASFNGDPTTLASTENPNMEAGAYITTGDYGKLLLMHLRGGACDDNQVLTQESLDLMHADRIGDVYGGDAYSAGRGYGMGWWVDRESGRISDEGAYGAVPWLDLADGYGAYLVIEADSATGNELAGLLYDVIDEAVTQS